MYGPICHNRILTGRACDAHCAALGAEAPSADEQREWISGEKMTEIPRFRGVTHVGHGGPQILVYGRILTSRRRADGAPRRCNKIDRGFEHILALVPKP